MLAIGLVVVLAAAVVLAWRLIWADSHGETVTDAGEVAGAWEPISVLGEELDARRYTANVTLQSHGDTWAFVAEGGCNGHRGYLDIDPSGQVNARVLGLDGPEMNCHGGDPQFPNLTALLAASRIQLTDDGALYLYDGDDMLASYDLIRDP